MSLWPTALLSRARVPQLSNSLIASREQQITRRTESHHLHRACMRQDRSGLPGKGIREPNRAVFPARGDRPVIGMEGGGDNNISVNEGRAQQLAGMSIPHSPGAGFLVCSAGRQQQVSVRTKDRVANPAL